MFEIVVEILCWIALGITYIGLAILGIMTVMELLFGPR